MALVELALLAATCAPNVHLSTLQPLIRHESRANIYAINVNGNYKLPKQPKNRDEAIATANWLKDNGYDFDAGLGQVNIRNIQKLGMTIADLFEPCENLKGAAAILTECYSRAVPRYGAGQPALLAALSCYNTGNFQRGFANGYVMKVASNVGMSVPALQPVESKSAQEPIRLKASIPGAKDASGSKPQSVQAVKQKEPQEGMADAFDSDSGDAFKIEDLTKKDEIPVEKE